jgi:hypothetical protein
MLPCNIADECPRPERHLLPRTRLRSSCIFHALRFALQLRKEIRPPQAAHHIMNRFALTLFLSCMSTALCAQDQAPTLLHEAAHCLVAGNVTGDHTWLDPQTLEAPELALAFQLDTKTLLGDEYLYVIVFTSPARNEGRIFDIRIKQHHDYSIENRASFVNSAKGVDFPQPPAGGQWAQTQFATAVQRILERRKWYTDAMKNLQKPFRHVQCESGLDKN